MSETRLNLQQKLFAVIEGLIRDTEIHNLDLAIPAIVRSPEYFISCEVGELGFFLEAPVTELDFAMDASVMEIIDQLIHPIIADAHIEALSSSVLDETVDAYHQPEIHDEPVSLTTRVIDFFKEYHLDSRFHYDTHVAGLDFAFPPLSIRNLGLAIFPIIKENTSLFRRLRVESPPAELSFIKETEQLYYWKLAVGKTHREAKKLKLLGVYPGVPRWAVENMKINYTSRALTFTYNVLADPGRTKEGAQDSIAIFSDLETDKTIIVSKPA